MSLLKSCQGLLFVYTVRQGLLCYSLPMCFWPLCVGLVLARNDALLVLADINAIYLAARRLFYQT